MVHPEQLAQHAADREPRVQRRVRVLEDHLDPPLVGARPAGRQHPAVEADLARVDRAQPGERQGERGLARPGLADQRERLPAGELQVDAVHRTQQPLLVADPGRERRADREVTDMPRAESSGAPCALTRRPGLPGQAARRAGVQPARSRSAASASWQRS